MDSVGLATGCVTDTEVGQEVIGGGSLASPPWVGAGQARTRFSRWVAGRCRDCNGVRGTLR